MNTDHRGSCWLVAGYAGLTGFFVLEAVFRRPGEASGLKASADDRGTTRWIVVAYGLAADLPLLAPRIPTRPLPPAAAPMGLLVQAAGLGLRAWSMRSLGRFYSRTLRIEGRLQPLVDSGPYRPVRHPGYLGSLLIWTGLALTSRSAPVVLLVGALLGAAYGRRISIEERLLRRELPGYTAYAARTKRLIPLLW